MSVDLPTSSITSKLEEMQEKYLSGESRTDIGNELFLFIDYFKNRIARWPSVSPKKFVVDYLFSVHDLERKVDSLTQRSLDIPHIPSSTISTLQLYFTHITKTVCPPGFAQEVIDFYKKG